MLLLFLTFSMLVILFLLVIVFWSAKVAQWWEHSPLTNVAWVQISASTPYALFPKIQSSSILLTLFERKNTFHNLYERTSCRDSTYTELSNRKCISLMSTSLKQRSGMSHWKEQAPYTLCMRRSLERFSFECRKTIFLFSDRSDHMESDFYQFCANSRKNCLHDTTACNM